MTPARTKTWRVGLRDVAKVAVRLPLPRAQLELIWDGFQVRRLSRQRPLRRAFERDPVRLGVACPCRSPKLAPRLQHRAASFEPGSADATGLRSKLAQSERAMGQVLSRSGASHPVLLRRTLKSHPISQGLYLPLHEIRGRSTSLSLEVTEPIDLHGVVPIVR